MHKDIDAYNEKQTGENKKVCQTLAELIDANLKKAESKVWHGGPVWCIDANPIVGYWVRKKGVQLLFWSGQSFDEKGLSPEGKFKAAQRIYESAAEIKKTELKRWLKKARDIQWDYKNIVKRKGKLVRL